MTRKPLPANIQSLPGPCRLLCTLLDEIISRSWPPKTSYAEALRYVYREYAGESLHRNHSTLRVLEKLDYRFSHYARPDDIRLWARMIQEDLQRRRLILHRNYGGEIRLYFTTELEKLNITATTIYGRKTTFLRRLTGRN